MILRPYILLIQVTGVQNMKDGYRYMRKKKPTFSNGSDKLATLTCAEAKDFK